MATLQDYQRYRMSRREPHTAPKKLIGWGVILVAGIFIISLFFRGGDNAPATANENTNTQAATESAQSTTPDNSNTNTAAETTTSVASFESINALLTDYNPGAQCTQTISRPGSGEVLLTFGLRRDGLGYERVLTTLKDESVPAAFFIAGNWAEDHENIVQAITDAGFPIYNQTQSQEDLTELSQDAVLQELEQGNETISGITERSTKPFMRPPFGAINDEVFATVTSAGYCPVLWSVDALDWEADATSFDIISRVMGALESSGVVLMHVGSAPTPDALPEIIRRSREAGKSFISLEQFATTQ